MNKIINKASLAEDRFMPKMHLRQPRFTCSICWPFTKNKEPIQKFEETGDWRYINENELHESCFHHDVAYGDFKDLPRKTAADKVLHDETFNIAKNLKYDGYQHLLASVVYKFFDKKTSAGAVESGHMLNQQLAQKLHRPIFRKFGKQKLDLLL